MIAREGLVPLALTSVLAIWVAAESGAAWSLPIWGACIYLAYLFRGVTAELPKQTSALVSPVPGRITIVDETRDPWLERAARRIRIALVTPGVGIVLSPTEGKIMDYWTSQKPFSAAADPPADAGSPNCYGLWLQSNEGDDIVFAVSSRLPISRFKLDAAPGERVGQGKRNGFIYFGSFVDLLMPLAATVEVDVGDRVVAGSAVLARLARDRSRDRGVG